MTYTLRRYGLTREQFHVMLIEQSGRCAVCSIPLTAGGGKEHLDSEICIDHDHETNEVRGLLCRRHNRLLAKGETPENLQAAAKYLQRSRLRLVKGNAA